ncbi:MAG: zf-HC2 domain-containing protein [Anaerolineae bacterium]
MQCPEASDLISLSLDMPLDSSAERRLQEHLAGCHTCTRERSAVQKLSSLLAAEPALSPSPLFTRNVLERIQQREAWRALLRRSALLITGLFVLATAGTLLVAGISSVAWQLLGSPSSASTIADVLLRVVGILLTVVRAAALIPRTLLTGTNPALAIAYVAATAALVLWWVKLIARPAQKKTW